MDVSQYLDIFIDETSEHLQDLNDCIMVLEKEPDNKDTINEIFRAAHSLKGMAGTMGFKKMQRLTHDMENVFQEVRSDKLGVSGKMIDVLFQCLDAIESYLENVKASSNEGTEDYEAVIANLNSLLEEDVEENKVVASKLTKKDELVIDTVDETKEYSLQLFRHEFTDRDLLALKNAAEQNENLYGFTIYVNPDCLLKAARAFLVFRAVEEYGNILVYDPTSQEIEDENFELCFNFILASSEKMSLLTKVALNVSEIDEVVCEQLFYEDIAGTTLETENELTTSLETSTTQIEETVNKKQTPATGTNKNQVAAKPVTNRTVRVDIEKLDTLMNQVSELIIAKNSLVSITGQEGQGNQNQTFHEQIEYLERITTSLHESVMKARMVPIESVVNKFPRMIRDLSKKLDKKMELYMTGEETELDRTVVDQIGDPLQHLLRNSADHGLESAEIRRKRGKPEVGSIYLNAYQEGNNVVIEVRDDGNGIDIDVVRAKAIERGIVSEEQAESLTKQEIIDFLFLPSFSMAKTVSDVSGRGVGLDVVKSNIEALGGDVEVITTLNEGSKFTVRLPLTLAIIQALMVEIEEEKYAIALGSIQNIEDIEVSEIKFVQAKEVIIIRGNVIPLIRLDKVLDIQRAQNHEQKKDDNLTVVIVRKGENFAGLVVDRLMGQQEIVIKSIGNYINNNKIISGSTILGDGEVALILDANTLI
jgi:two-component system, chemotaxis family, sensor kinase CheA